MAASESGGDQLHLTEYCRNFAKMDAVETLRQYSRRYTTAQIVVLLYGKIRYNMDEVILCLPLKRY
jgi:hypothetical protein